MASSAASSIISSTQTVQVDGQEMDTYFSLPGGPGLFPAILVCQHAGGVDQFIRETADRLASEGYAAAAPNLFHRYTEEMLAERSQRSQHLSDPDIVADINSTVDFLRNHASVNREKIGITGFCMGGRVSWLASATNPYFRAVAPYYGGNLMVTWGEGTQTPFELAGNLNCPMLFHFAELDENPSQSDMRVLDDQLTRLGKPHQFYTYPEAGHAFMDYTQPRHHRTSAEMSWPRTLEFFARHLKEGG